MSATFVLIHSYGEYCIILHTGFLGLINHHYLGFFDNQRMNNISILLITAEIYQVRYSIEAPGVGYYHSGTISAGDEVILNLPESLAVLSIYDQDKGIYLATSSDRVTVIGQNLILQSSDSFFALPVIEIDYGYVYYGVSVSRSSFGASSSILIVGTENNTMMKLTVTQSVNIDVGNTITTLTRGIEYSFVINRLQTIYIESREDLSGTKIVTNKPVSVFSGHQCADVPPENNAVCSYLIEQIPPTALWGKAYFTTPLANMTSYTIKTLAAYNSTNVNVYCNNSVQSYIINEGEFNVSQMNEYCVIYSNKKVLVFQFSHGASESNSYGAAMMIIVPATELYLDTFDFSTIRNHPFESVRFDHYVNLVVMEQYYQPNMIYLISGGVNRSLDTQQWVPIQVNNTSEAYATQVNISEGVTQIFHTDTSAQMMTIVYGFYNYDSYGHIGGLNISTATGY